MSIKAIDFNFTGATSSLLSAYDPAKTSIGTLMQQYTGPSPMEKYAGPFRVGIARPFEQSTSIPAVFPHVIRFSDTIDWVFVADNAAAGVTRRVALYEFSRTTSVYNWKGFVTLTYPTATNHTIRGLRVVRELYTTGTVQVSGTGVTGAGSTWTTSGMCVGSRIGFGSTAPSAITTWYEISAVGSNTTITLTSSAGTISAGTPYVIEDMRILTATSNATTTNGGLYVTKGIRYELFTPGGTIIPTAVSTDNIRAVYWLADAASVTNITAGGCAIGSLTSWTDQRAYVVDQNFRCYVYNFRAALTLASGKDTTTNIIRTGVATLTGTISQVNNGRLGTLTHGPASGEESLFFVTTSRIYRSRVGDITANNANWPSDVMTEIPPGGVNTYVASGALSSVEVAGSMDRLVVSTSGAAGIVSYITKYNTTADAMDYVFLCDNKQQNQSIADSGLPNRPTTLSLPFTVWVEDGVMHMTRVSAVAATNQMFSVPIAAHWDFALEDSQLIVTPSFDISDSTKLYSVSVRHASYVGGATFSTATEPFRTYYRTSGINDNSGMWTLVSDTGDMSSVNGTLIQFAFAFKIIGETAVPARLYGLTLSYEDSTTDSHYEPSVGRSSIPSRVFAYRQRTAWGSNIPDIRIRLYNATTGTLVLDDTIGASAFGTFERSTDGGGSWLAWLASDDTVGNYIRYTASALPDGVRIRALLTQ